MTKCPTKILESLPYFRFLHHPIKKKKGFLSRKKGKQQQKGNDIHIDVRTSSRRGEERKRDSIQCNVQCT